MRDLSTDYLTKRPGVHFLTTTGRTKQFKHPQDAVSLPQKEIGSRPRFVTTVPKMTVKFNRLVLSRKKCS